MFVKCVEFVILYLLVLSLSLFRSKDEYYNSLNRHIQMSKILRDFLMTGRAKTKRKQKIEDKIGNRITNFCLSVHV